MDLNGNTSVHDDLLCIKGKLFPNVGIYAGYLRNLFGSGRILNIVQRIIILALERSSLSESD